MVSIIIINYKTFDYTKKCIESIIQYTKNIAFEIILVDNFSNDGSAEKLKHLYPTLTHIQNNTNLGFSKANNIGILEAKGDVILLLNSDTELFEDTISYCYDYIMNGKTNSIVSCKLIYPNNQIQYQCSTFPSIKNNIIEMFRLQKLLSKEKAAKVLYSTYFDHNSEAAPEWIWGTFFMFHKKSLEKLNHKKLDDTFFMYGEDMKWCYDFKHVGCNIVYLPNKKIIHHVGKSSTVISEKTNQIVKNELQFICLVKGRAYKLIYKFIRILNLLSSLNANNYELSKLYLKY